MPANDPKVMTIVAEALKRTDPAARATYLDSVCADDARFPPAGRSAARHSGIPTPIKSSGNLGNGQSGRTLGIPASIESSGD